MTDREKARDLGNQSAALARSIADVLNDTLDALEAAEARVTELKTTLALAKEQTYCQICGDTLAQYQGEYQGGGCMKWLERWRTRRLIRRYRKYGERIRQAGIREQLERQRLADDLANHFRR